MKNRSKHRSNKNGKSLRMRQCSSYEPDFKKAVVLYAEQKSTSEAKRRYGISESNIRRWRRLKNDILEKASQVRATRKSTRSNNIFESSVEDFDAFELSNSLDSMPLEQRLSKTSAEQEPVLQSQPLSPTKLKVTRQSAKPPQPSPKPATPEPPNEEVCLRWNSHHSNMQSTFPNLLLREQYVDATLVAEGQTLKCHRLILSSCSPYFEEVLSGISPFQHPVLFMKDVPFWILKSLCDFMYAGEVHIFQNKLEELLAVAESLKIKGLAGKPEGGNEEAKPAEPVKAKEEKEKKEEKEVKDRKKQQIETPAAKNTSKLFRSTYTSKRNEKSHRELVKSDDILDPLDLLEPVYEELTKESKPSSAPTKFKEAKPLPVKKALPKKIKKRKLSEEREESPPPLFLSRKGTRSRPNVKIPKYYHATYDRATKSMESLESTIVREPHTDQADPLMQVEEIKAEPLDLEDDVIEIEDNIIGFSDQEMPMHDEEIIGNYDSPIVNISDGKKSENRPGHLADFKKISLLQQPIIMDVHSISEKSESSLEIVDVSQIQSPSEIVHDKSSDPIIMDVHSISEKSENSLEIVDVSQIQSPSEIVRDKSSDPIIMDVHSISEKSENGLEIVDVSQIQSPSGIVRDKSNDPIIMDVHSISEKSENSLKIVDVSQIQSPSEIVRDKSSDPIIMDVHSVSEKSENSLEIFDVSQIQSPSEIVQDKNSDSIITDIHITLENPLKIVDVAQIQIPSELVQEKSSDPLATDTIVLDLENNKAANDPLQLNAEPEEKTTGDIKITNVESVTERLTENNVNSLEGKNEDILNFHVEGIVSEEDGNKECNSDFGYEIEKVVSENENQVSNEENANELGFHIAKVASEQFTMSEENKSVGKDVVSEDRASDLGFQITNVVSGHFEEADSSLNADNPQKDSNDTETETVINELSEMVGESQERKDGGVEWSSEIANVNNTLSEETKGITESLEELLDK